MLNNKISTKAAESIRKDVENLTSPSHFARSGYSSSPVIIKSRKASMAQIQTDRELQAAENKQSEFQLKYMRQGPDTLRSVKESVNEHNKGNLMRSHRLISEETSSEGEQDSIGGSSPRRQTSIDSPTRSLRKSM